MLGGCGTCSIVLVFLCCGLGLTCCLVVREFKSSSVCRGVWNGSGWLDVALISLMIYDYERMNSNNIARTVEWNT